MKMERMLIQVPKRLKSKLDVERKRGTSAAGLIRHLLENHFQRAAKESHLLEPKVEILHDSLPK